MADVNDFDVAIVGMAGRFPGARNVGEFWRNLAAGVESITQFTDEDILESGVPESHLRNPAYVKASPVLEDPAMFDATFFGYSPVEASAMDPQQRLLLELAYEALEDAGHDPERSAARVGVFTGSALNTYYTVAGLNARITEDYIPTLIGNDKDFLSTRISYKLNLRGPSLAVQTACSTSMVAVHLARQSLLSGETDLAIAGAISVRVPHRAGYICDGGGVVSPDGRVRPFDASANGTVFGSGGGVIVLKRLTDAIADGDTIRAVIKGSAVNNDGSEKAGYTAPSVNSQADAVIEALANANVDAESVSYIEAHGSGTPVGDPIEVAALTKAFRAFTQRSAFCAIGSVKSNVGHLDAAAGMAGIIKTVLALQHKQLPPSLHYTTPNPEIDFANTPFFVSASLRDWAATGPRRAGVMATGMGGTNAHVVLEEAPASSAATETPGPHLLVLSAKTDTALDDATQRLREFVATNAHVGASDIACTLRNGRRAFAQRRFVVCSDRADAVKALDLGAKRPVTGRATDARRSVVLLLPGVSDHYVGMAHELYTRSTVFRAEIDRCAHILQPLLNADIREILYPAGEPWKNRTKGKGIDLRKMLGRSADTPSDAHTAKLNQTQFVQAALFTIEYATTRLWQSLGVLPDAIAGHSMGEYVAACIGGVMSLEDALRLLATRAKLVSALPKGGMLAVTLSEQEVLETLPADLSISLINGPSLCVVAGPPESIAAFEKVLTKRGVICRHVPNTHAFHSRMLAPIADAFEREVRTVTLNAPTIPYISNVTGTWITASEATDPAYWAKHATHTARFSDALRAVWQLDDPLLIEAGPGRTLGVLATQHPDKPHDADATAVASIRHDFDGKSDMEMLYDAIGRVWLTGVSVNWDSLTNAAPTRRVPLPTYPFERRRHWLQPVRNAPVNASASTLQKNANTSEWLYVPSWKRTLARSISLYRAADPVDAARPWLVFADESGFSNALAERIARSGRDVIVVRAGTRFDDTNRGAIRIDPANAEHYTQLVRALQAWQLLPDRVVHAWCADDSAGRDHADAFERAQTAGFFSVLHLARACAALNVRHDMRWFVVSNGAHDVTGTETLHTERATILGPCMVIRQEYPNIRVRSIDVANVTDDAERGTLTDAITGELVSNDPELFVAYRGGQRWVQSYERVRPQAARGIREPFRERGVYLITGGLGTVGAAIATYLAQRYKARIVLVGRAAAPRDPALLVRIAQLGGQALYMSANVSDAHAARRVVDETRRRFGTLHGVIHGAGIVGDGVYREIKDSDAAYCARHFEAKAHGVRALSDALADVRVDFCLLLSSLTSVLGGIGQAAYTSANMYMDVFARHHNRTSRSPWLSVNWDVWRLDTAASSGAGMGATLKDLGMNTAESMSTLEAVLSSAPVGQLVVSTGDLSARIDQWLNLSSLEAPAVAGAAAGALAERPKLQSAYDAPRDDTERRIAEIWQESLGIADIGINDNFAELGGHSLLAVRIVASLRNAFQIDVPVRALFDSPTIASLATAIKDQLIAEIGAMSDEEARRLVSTA